MDSFVLSAVYSDAIRNKPTHYHDRHQILYIQSGQIVLDINGRHYTASDGAVIIISRFEQHSIEVLSEEYKRYALFVSPAVHAAESPTMQHLMSVLVNRPLGFTHVICTEKHAAALEHLFSSICREKSSGSPLQEYMQSLLFQQVLVLLYRAEPKLFSAQPEEAYSIVENIKTILENEYDKAYTLQSISEKYNISPSYLSHIFKRVTGCSVMNYRLSCRLAAAKRLLAKTDNSIGKIVEECGFSDCSNFSRTFKEHTGISPSAFRKKFRQ